jgi:hypothetical protein
MRARADSPQPATATSVGAVRVGRPSLAERLRSGVLPEHVRRAIAWLLVGVVMLVLVAGEALQPGAGSGVAGRSGTLRRDQSSVLPLTALGPVSAALGRADSGYRVTGLRARNPAQHLDVDFSGGGVSVASGAARIRLRLTEFGYASALKPVGLTRPHATGNRVLYSHRDGLREWYANGPLGLEQGFDLATRPRTGTGRLTLSLALAGDLRARLTGNAVNLTGHGATLRYGGLVATDARGHRLPASLSLRGGRIVISVDARNARYPVRVDPFVQAANLNEPAGYAFDSLGYSTAASGSTIAVGAPGHVVGGNASQGAVFVFTKPITGWATTTHSTMLTASDGVGGDSLGFTVATNGTTVVSGAPGHAGGGNAGQGAAYVWVEHNGTWTSTQAAELTAPDGAAMDDGGYLPVAISPDGDTIVFAAGHHTVGTNAEQGEAYAFTQPPGGWGSATPQVAELTAGDGGANDVYGLEVAASDDTLAVQGGLGGGGSEHGAIYVYVKSGGAWHSGTQQAELTATGDPTLGVGSGSLAISADGSTVASGAPVAVVGSNSGQGAVFVFDRPGSTWADAASQSATLTASDGAGGDDLGFAIGFSGTTIVAGAPGRTVGGDGSAGAAVVFNMPPGGWHGPVSQTQELTPTTTTGAGLGYSLGYDGTTIAAGTHGHQLGDFVFTPEYKVSGTLSGVQCAAGGGCVTSGLGGFKVLVTNRASDGSGVSVSDVTGDDGSWSVMVPPGTYTAGVVGADGVTFVGPSIVPSGPEGSVPGTTPVVVAAGDVPNVDFHTCAAPVDSSGASDSRSLLSAASDPFTSPEVAHTAAASFAPSLCISSYTLSISAKIPQKIFVDPSPDAHYNRNSNPHLGEYVSGRSYVGARGVVIEKNEYPECMPPGKVTAYTNGHAEVEWYSYIDGGVSLGKVDLPVTWNQDTGKTDLLSEPVETTGTLTREFRWRVRFPGHKPLYDKCTQTAHVPMLVWAVAGADGVEAKLAKNEFTVVAAWWLPFDAPGLTLPPKSSAAEKIVEHGVKLVKELYDKYEKLPAYQKFALEFTVGLLLGTVEVKAVEAGPPAVARLLAKYAGPYLTEAQIADAEGLASIAKYSHHLLALAAERAHQFLVADELLGLYTGYHGYPTMAAVIRGKFSTPDKTYNASTKEEIPDSTMLAVSVKSTKFPNISLKVNRNAFEITNHGPVFTGFLPWKTALSGTPETYNPMSATFPASFIADSKKTGHSYGSGEAAVNAYKTDTAQTPEVGYGLKHYGNLSSNFGAEEAEADDPECDAAGFKNVSPREITTQPQTICWFFTDGRP